ncbi:hypothetical protein BU26DRAFT_556321 [Trematosphaeria pertusa]|uniref:Uncharacterized protein n=1 Tax=Trematosphaeria pertusa TaxID=390896 RepID=A0A6A6HT59_9PLEO|nr:uncharacterized protein BU26DRAFT_556321 [Trematosphaeria pertusa]KAF2241197.1 hypothetical protein BU26DRAFT_556321 [Trematosphaeria pertusa]
MPPAPVGHSASVGRRLPIGRGGLLCPPSPSYFASFASLLGRAWNGMNSDTRNARPQQQPYMIQTSRLSAPGGFLRRRRLSWHAARTAPLGSRNYHVHVQRSSRPILHAPAIAQKMQAEDCGPFSQACWQEQQQARGPEYGRARARIQQRGGGGRTGLFLSRLVTGCWRRASDDGRGAIFGWPPILDPSPASL